MEVSTQKSFDENAKNLTSSSKTSKSKKWIKECWDYHSQHIDDHGLSIGWDAVSYTHLTLPTISDV